MGRKFHFSFSHRGRGRHDRIERDIDISVDAIDKKEEKLTYKGSLKVKPNNRINGNTIADGRVNIKHWNRQIGNLECEMNVDQPKKESLKSEEDAVKGMEVGQTRRVSASVGEIKELYSVLHQLVPGQSQKSTRVSPGSKLTKSQSMTMRKTNAVGGRLEVDRKNTSPASMASYNFSSVQRSQSHTMLNAITSTPAVPKRRGSLDNLLAYRSENEKDVSDGPLKTPVTKRKSVEGAVKCLEENRHKCASKRASLVDAISILARDPDSVQRLISKHAQAEEEQEMNNNDSSDKLSQTSAKNSLLDNQMQQLLQSINELQSSYDIEPGMNDEEILQTLNRKGSVGTEMKDLLTTLNDLNSNQNSSSVDHSRRGSKVDGREAPKESLEELEAFFIEKLKESTLKEKQQSRMVKQASVDSKDSDVSIPVSLTSSSRKESMESDYTSDGMAFAAEKCDNQPTTSQVSIPLDKSVQEKFAQQVCERLETWLQKATALSEQEKENLRAKAACRDRNSRKGAKRRSESNDKNYAVTSTGTKQSLPKHYRENQTAQSQGSELKKSRSLHNLLFGEDRHFKMSFLQKFRSPKSGRKKNKVSKHENTAALKLDRRRSRSLYDSPRRLPSCEFTIDNILEHEVGAYTNPRRLSKSKLVPSTSGPSRLTSSVSCENLLQSSRSCDNLVLLRNQAYRQSSSDSLESADSQRESRQCLAGRSRLPTDLPLFYTPDSSQATVLKMSRKVNRIRTQTNTTKETPPIRKQLLPHTERLKKYKRNMFYGENREHNKIGNTALSSDSQHMSLIDPGVHLSQTTLKNTEKYHRPDYCSKATEADKVAEDDVFVAAHSYDSDELMDLRHEAKHSESDNDSGCAASTEHLNKVCWPGTSEMSVQTDPVIVLAEGTSRTEYYKARARVKPTCKTLQVESLV